MTGGAVTMMISGIKIKREMMMTETGEKEIKAAAVITNHTAGESTDI
jgi:hypothetical protein